MAVFNFTVRATDSEGSFADRSFNINVRNSKIERYLSITSSHAYSSVDGVTWTERTGQGGYSCAYGNGFWLVWDSNGFRKSYDAVNWSFIAGADTVWTNHVGTAASFSTSGNAVNKMRFLAGKFIIPGFCTTSGLTSVSTGSLASSYTPGIWVSDDGISWTFKNAPNVSTGSVSFNSVNSFYNGLTVTEDNGTIIMSNARTAGSNYMGWMTSDMGNTWTPIYDTTKTGNQYSGILTRFNGLYISYQGIVLTGSSSQNGYAVSSDGVNWTVQSSQVSNGQHIASMIYANGTIYANSAAVSTMSTGTGAALYTSTTGSGAFNVNTTAVKRMNSSAMTSQDPQHMPSFAYKNGVFLWSDPRANGSDNSTTVGSVGGGIRLSTDGVNWSQVNQFSSVSTPFRDVAIM